MFFSYIFIRSEYNSKKTTLFLLLLFLCFRHNTVNNYNAVYYKFMSQWLASAPSCSPPQWAPTGEICIYKFTLPGCSGGTRNPGYKNYFAHANGEKL